METDDSKARPRGRPRDEQLTAKRCDDILDAAARIFAERGFGNTDVQVVADQLGLGKGTIYRYFPTKRELFLAAVDRGMRQLRERVDAYIRLHDPLQRVVQGIHAYLKFFEENPHYVELFMQERAEFKDRETPTYFKHREANYQHWESVIRELVQAGHFRNIALERVHNVVGDLLYGTMFTNYFTPRKLSAEQQARDVLDVILNGLLTDEARAKLNADSLRPANETAHPDGPPAGAVTETEGRERS